MKILEYIVMNWYKKAQNNWPIININWYKKSKNEITAQKMFRMPVKEFEKRLKEIGWDLSRKGPSDYMAFAPDGHTKLTIATNNWDLRYMEARKQLLRQNLDLEFVFEPVFKIPPNFNIRTQKIEVPQIQHKIIPIRKKESLPQDLENYEILIENKWIKPEVIDWINYTVMDINEKIYTIPDTNIQIRRKIS